MRQFVISTAAMMVFSGLMAAAPASALENYGPTKVGNQCFTSHMGKDLYYGVWGACAEHASTPAAAPARRTVRRHAAR